MGIVALTRPTISWKQVHSWPYPTSPTPLQLPVLPADATFALIASPSASTLSVSKPGVPGPLPLKLARADPGHNDHGNPGQGPTLAAQLGDLTPPTVPPLSLSTPELAKLMSTPAHPPGPMELQSPLSAFLSDHTGALRPCEAAGLTPDAGDAQGFLESLMLDLGYDHDDGGTAASTAGGALEGGGAAAVERASASQPALLSPACGTTPLAAALGVAAGLGAETLSPGLPGLMSPSLLSASLPDDF